MTLPQRSCATPCSSQHVVQARGAVDAELGLQRPRRVVDARVDDAAVVAGLVEADLVLLVEDGDPQARTPRQQLARDGEPDDPGADDRDVVVRWHATRV